jgi:tetratricopeptide (TPR) repeat protein
MYPGLSKDFPEPDAQTHQVAEHAENPCAAPTHETSNDPSQSSGSVPSDAGPMEICQDRWPFDWSTVDVPGSPGLSRLFSALEIEAKTFVPPLSLETPESEDSRCLSNVEILVLSDKDRNAIPDDFDYLHLSRDGECSAPIGTASSHYPHYPWRDINAVFFGHAPSPFNEVYIFPPSYTAARKTPVSRITELEALELEETDLEIKFAKLKKQLHVDHPAVIAIMEDLAFIYWDLNKILKAERMYRRLVDIYRRTSASTPLKILKACLDVVDCVRMRGHFRKAQCMNQSLRAVLLKLVYPYHPLALNIMETDAIIAYHLGQNGKAECLRRELLQISLTASGPRNGKTMGLMISLGRTITKGKTKKVEGEMLLQTAVQLALDTNDEIMSDAIYLLTYTKPAEEAYNMITNAIERFRGTLGPRHPNIFHLQMHLAWNMLKLGMLHEGEKLYRALISLSAESRDGEWSCSDLSYLHKGLAKALRTTGRVEEAIYWYQKALEEQLTCYGANDVLTRGTCRGLAWCYQDQGRYDDALKLYHQMIDKVRQSGEDPDGANAEFESEILRIQERMEQSTSHSYSSDEESSEYESVSNSEGLYEGEQPAVETDEEPKGVANDEAEDHGIEEAESEEEKEDWMAFIIDLPTA